MLIVSNALPGIIIRDTLPNLFFFLQFSTTFVLFSDDQYFLKGNFTEVICFVIALPYEHCIVRL